MTDTALPLPGTIGLTSISGEVGKLIHLGQYLAENPVDRWFAKNDEPKYEHAFVYLGDGKIIEAEPGGARIRPVTEYSTIYWCTGIAGKFTEDQLAAAADKAHTFEGVKYSFLDYFALAAHRLHMAPLLKGYIQSTDHMICSQLCDAAYRAAGLEIFRDQRWTGYVMPMDLYLVDVGAKTLQSLLGIIDLCRSSPMTWKRSR